MNINNKIENIKKESDGLGKIIENINYFILLDQKEEHNIDFAFIKERDFLSYLGYNKPFNIPGEILNYLHPNVEKKLKKNKQYLKPNSEKKIIKTRVKTPDGSKVPVLRFTAVLIKEKHIKRFNLHGICLNYPDSGGKNLKRLLKVLGTFLFNLIRDKVIRDIN